MRLKLLPLAFLSLICAIAASGQVIDETRSTADLGPNGLDIVLQADNRGSAREVSANLDLVNTAGVVVAKTSPTVNLDRGKQQLRFTLPIDGLDVEKNEDLIWYRLRYSVGNAWGTISLSQMIADIFELRVAAWPNVAAGMTYRVRVTSTNPFTRQPVAGVALKAQLSLELRSGDDDELEISSNAVTDEQGVALIEFSIPAGAELDSDGKIEVIGSKKGVVRSAEDDIRNLTNVGQFLIMTDKGLYQPDQTINVRGIYLEGAEGKTVVSGREVDLRIEDGDGTAVFRQKVATSDFGIAAISWQIPANAKLGTYVVVARDTFGERIGRQDLKVSRYDLPNFVVKAEPDKAYYLPTDQVAELVIRADYLFGKPVTKGTVRVVEETDRQWNWREQKYDIEEGSVYEGETDAEGKFTARFPLSATAAKLKDGDWRKYIDVNFAAYFTDPTTNRTEQRRFDIRVNLEPIHLYFITRPGSLHPDLPITGYVTAFYADGTPAECDISFTASDQRDEGYRRITRARTNSHGVAKAVFRTPTFDAKRDDFYLRITATDRNGLSGTITEDIDFTNDDTIQITTSAAIYQPGSPMDIELVSSKPNGIVRVDIVRGWTALKGYDVAIKNGRGKLRIAYDPQFQREIKLVAYLEPDEDGDDDEIVRSTAEVIFPVPQNLQVEARFDNAIYKPGADAKISFGVKGPDGRPVESALGIAIIDTAVEERSRTDSQFGSIVGNYFGWLGYGRSVGSVNVKDIRDIDTTKPIPPDLQLVAEVLFADASFRPSIFFSDNLVAAAKNNFTSHTAPQATMVRRILRTAFDSNESAIVRNETELSKLLRENNVEFDLLRDPWDQRYRAVFGYQKNRAVVRLISSGPDKRSETADDFEILNEGFQYFSTTGRGIDAVVRQYAERTGGYIRDEKTLYAELGVSELLDVHGRPYVFDFYPSGRFFEMRINSVGADGRRERSYWLGDDFNVWTSRIDYFASTAARIATAQKDVKKIPMTVEEFTASLLSADIDLASLRDGYGNPYYVTTRQFSRAWNNYSTVRIQEYGVEGHVTRQIATPVTQEVISFTIRSRGSDGKEGTPDDVTMTAIIHVLSERSKDDPAPVIKKTAFNRNSASNFGTIGGTVIDVSGAVVPGADVAATNLETQNVSKTATNNAGRFALSGLSPGKYKVAVTALGFNTTVINNVVVASGKTTELTIALDIGGVSEMVTVSSGIEVLNSTNHSVSTTVTSRQIESLPLAAREPLTLLNLQPGAAAGKKDEISTPRLRQYFPETLLWNPELITGADGRAEIGFTMADNITTWKVYTIASTRDGKVGFAEKEVTSFQSFFADLDPPRYLTEGDEISLPVQVRNYTDRRQKVGVKMDAADWFAFLEGGRREIDVASGESSNAVFGFRTVRTVKDGKQRVTAVAQTDSDAIEKPVTVRPNGQEIVRTQSRYFDGNETISADFPAQALPGTPRTEIKIYANLFSHITESVEGLLQRPYGCGEQTVSSTYPNLMIVKFVADDTPLRRSAMRNLVRGTERLLGYQGANGGFTYWGGRSEPDLALTAYALRFLRDAGEFVTVDRTVVERAEKWLLSQQQPDGSWNAARYGSSAASNRMAKMLTTYVARSLSMRSGSSSKPGDRPATGSELKASLTKAIAFLHARNAEIDDPYTLALLGLISIDSGDRTAANAVGQRLAGLAKEEADSAYWNLETNTPFNGWGRTGRIETTALAVNLLTRLGTDDPKLDKLAANGMQFLFKNKDRYGVWYSTQTTVNVLDTFMALLGRDAQSEQNEIEMLVNGRSVKRQTIQADQIEPLIIDLSDHLNARQNSVEIRGTAGSPLLANLVTEHFIDWKDADTSGREVNQSRAIELSVDCDRTSVAIMDEITCSVKAARVGFQGYGMLLAEIGTPPGADVSREALEKAIENDQSISRYEVLPDRVIVYMWAMAGGTKFDLKFKPRYGINALTPPSQVYDYYNPEARAVVAPLRFTAR